MSASRIRIFAASMGATGFGVMIGSLGVLPFVMAFSDSSLVPLCISFGAGMAVFVGCFLLWRADNPEAE